MASQSHIYPPKHLAFVSLALGFLVIWTAVLAGLLVSRAVKDNHIAEETTKVFHTHEDVGKITFALGHELVSIVDWLLSKISQNITDKDILSVTWKFTDSVLKNIQETSSQRWVHSVAILLDTIEVKLNKFRETLTPNTNPLQVIDFYLELNNMIIRKCFLLDYAGQHLPIPSLSYTLFLKGMTQKFGEMAFGTVYVKSDLPVNKSEFLSLRTGGDELMESAFHFTPRARTKWWELQDQEPRVQKVLGAMAEDLVSGGSLRGHRELAIPYLDGVREQIAMLLLTKEVLNSTLASWVEKFAQKSNNTLAFHTSIACVAILAVVLCLIVTGCSCNSLNQIEQKTEVSQNQDTSSDRTQILTTPDYLKPQCYL